MTEGVFDILFMLASFDQICLDATTDEQQQINERLVIIQNLAAKAISAISSLVAFQTSIIELIQSSRKLSYLLRSRNDEVRKYMAKTIAYLSLRNGKFFMKLMLAESFFSNVLIDKYKPNLLNGDDSRALVSILVILPLKDNNDKEARIRDLSYYLSKQIQTEEEVTAQWGDQTLNSATISHACCALANFATNSKCLF